MGGGVLTLTDAGFLVEVVSGWTFTLEAAKGVDADSTLAETRQLLALVDVWGRRSHAVSASTLQWRALEGGGQTFTFQDDGDGVGPEALPSGTQRLVLRCGQRQAS